MTHAEVVAFLTKLMKMLFDNGLHSTYVLDSVGIHQNTMKAYLRSPEKRGARLIPVEALAALITAIRQEIYICKKLPGLQWHMKFGGDYYYEVLDAHGQHIQFNGVFMEALEVADQYQGSVENIGRAPILNLDQNQSLRSRWRRAIYSRQFELAEICRVTGYDEYRVVTTGLEEHVLMYVSRQPDEAAVVALEELAARGAMIDLEAA
ncbi:hypothetical protein [Shinella sp.]|uniref:hypothetical protein n=1 Tax=Shinella sp. TaxID=1870904 RepID=UPI0039E51B6C